MEVITHPNESFESLLKRFKRLVQRDGVLAQLCNRRLLGGKPSYKKKFKKEKALVRFRKREKARNSFGG
jgi:small subunit ribosomal protein S21